MKIVIVGPGAIGCLWSGLLARHNSNVWILDKLPERSQLIAQRGISVEGLSGSFLVKLKATADPKEIGIADFVIIAVKSYDTKTAALHAAPLIGEQTKIVTLQNGIGNIEIISEIAGGDKVIGGITNAGATLLGTAHVKHAGIGETIVGQIDGKMPVELRQIRELFTKAGLETRISRDIKGLLWSKLIINVGINALTAITHLQNGRLIEFEGTRRIMREAVTEAVKIAKRKRIRLAYDDPLAKVESVCETTAGNVSSMLQDVIRKKHTEIEFINGVIVRLGQELGIATPVNSMLVDIVKTIENSYTLVVDQT